MVGSFLGGFILNLIEYHTLAVHALRAAGILGSILGAIILLILLRVTGWSGAAGAPGGGATANPGTLTTT